MMVFQPGTYEHECPGCGHKVVFVVGTTLGMDVLPTSSDGLPAISFRPRAWGH
jgi:hypothetical protein